jgi:hypothetical protein
MYRVSWEQEEWSGLLDGCRIDDGTGTGMTKCIGLAWQDETGA